VTKRVGNAVVRNRIKRRFREAARAISSEKFQFDHDYVLIGKRAALSEVFDNIVLDLSKALDRSLALGANPQSNRLKSSAAKSARAQSHSKD